MSVFWIVAIVYATIGFAVLWLGEQQMDIEKLMAEELNKDDEMQMLICAMDDRYKAFMIFIFCMMVRVFIVSAWPYLIFEIFKNFAKKN